MFVSLLFGDRTLKARDIPSEIFTRHINMKVIDLELEMNLGGLQRTCNQLIRMLDRQSFEPFICCLARYGIFYDQTVSNRARSFIIERGLVPFGMKLLTRFHSILRRNKIDIINSHSCCSFYSILAGRLSGVKAIVHIGRGCLVPDTDIATIADRLSSFIMNRYVGVSHELTAIQTGQVRLEDVSRGTRSSDLALVQKVDR